MQSTPAMATLKKPRRSASRVKAAKKVALVMHEFKEGTLRSGGSGTPVTSRKQAIAIGLAEARRDGARVARKKSAPAR